MKSGFYAKPAVMGIRKNKRLYVPYILTCIGMIMMQYIITYLSLTPAVRDMPKGAIVQTVLGMGIWVILIFAAIFLLYTNSFLMRRRKKEFGLYNILGMGKFNIGRILIWESIMVALISLAVGLGAGILLSKFAELGLVNVIDGDVNFTFSICPEAITFTTVAFCVVFILILIINLLHISCSNPMSLFKSENVGEKPPKANWLFGIAGVFVLAAAYYIAVSIKQPMAALSWFFIAVIMVIIATYMLFISGSVLLCRILQKKKNYYYKKSHFVSVSSMMYRMKRNGAGLASICILGTMVLVMIASTACLYFGKEDSLEKRYPRDITVKVNSSDIIDDKFAETFYDAVNGKLRGNSPKNIIQYRYVELTGLFRDGILETDAENYPRYNSYTGIYDDLCYLYFVPLSEYNRITGKNKQIADGSAMLYFERESHPIDTVTIKNGVSYKVSEVLTEFPVISESASYIVPCIYAVIPDFDEAADTMKELLGSNIKSTFRMCCYYAFDIGTDDDTTIAIFDDMLICMNDLSRAYLEENKTSFGYSAECLATNKAHFYGTFGGLFFLGILLSIVFIFAAVLIIYYKQISEGYEDQSRFDIMQKVGMTKQEIRKSINSQMLTVFLLPLIMAGMHLAFAFPIICKLLMLFNVINVNLLIVTALISFLAFALFYTLFYRVTSNAYYNIVSGVKEE